MSEIVEDLGGGERGRIETLRKDGRFFWVDLSLTDATREQLSDVLGIPDHALRPLLDFSESSQPSRKFHADGDHVVFPFHCFMTSGPGEDETEEEEEGQLKAIEV